MFTSGFVSAFGRLIVCCSQVTLLHLLDAQIDCIQKEFSLSWIPSNKISAQKPIDTPPKWNHFLDPKLVRPCCSLARKIA